MINFYKYRVQVYEDDNCIGTFGYVPNVWFISVWLKINPIYGKWTSIRVYDRNTDDFIGQYSRGEDIPAKP
jgi:hypothetical protein